MYSYSLQIQGMTCGGCAASVQRKLDALEDIVSCEVNFATETARIESQEALKPKQLIDWIRSFGFSVQTDHQRFQATDDRFDQASLDLILSTHPEVVSYQINSPLKTLDYTTLPDANDRDLQNQLTHQGLVKATHQDVAIDRTSTTDRTHVWISGILALPLVLQMIGMWFGSSWHLPVIIEWALATPIQFWLGYRFYQGAWAALKRGEANMDTLVALGTTVAYCYSLFQWATLGQDAIGHLYFEASAVVITLVLVGKAIEAKAKHSALESVAALFALKPKTVTCLRHAQEIELSIQELVSGDVLIIRSGERIGADGVIIKGDAEIDASAMTGESIPEYKVTGDSVISGTLVVNGTIRVSAERVGDASTVSQVAALVKNAQMGKAPIQQLVDRISRIFVPTVLILALLTLGIWLFVGETLEYALVAAISVLVIACPCALGLATPTALVAGTGLAAKHGILIKDIQTLEALPDVEVIAFDKTGTLTKGEPKVTTTEPMGCSSQQLITRLVQVARESIHPLAQAMVRDLGRSVPAVTPDEAVTRAGQGISVRLQGAEYRLGHLEFVTSAAMRPETPVKATRSYLSCDGELLGFVEFSDTLRDEAETVIQTLKTLGKTTLMLTGDHLAVADTLAHRLGIDHVHAQLTPNQKIEMIQAYQQDGRQIAMVGDGINDGPALAQADVGIAIGSGNEIALKSAPVVLMRADLQLLPAAIEYARRTRQVIRQNLGWAFGYNLLCIPLAMSGLLTPSIAGAAMALSSVSVVANALRLKYSN